MEPRRSRISQLSRLSERFESPLKAPREATEYLHLPFVDARLELGRSRLGRGEPQESMRTRVAYFDGLIEES